MGTRFVDQGADGEDESRKLTGRSSVVSARYRPREIGDEFPKIFWAPLRGGRHVAEELVAHEGRKIARVNGDRLKRCPVPRTPVHCLNNSSIATFPERPGDSLSARSHVALQGRPHPDLLVDRSTSRPTPACRRTSGPLKEGPRECWSRSTPLPLGEGIASWVVLGYGKLRDVDVNS